jgi:hypothetical protein
VIQNWIESYYYELLEEKDFTEALYQFVKEVINNATVPEMETMKYFRSMFFVLAIFSLRFEYSEIVIFPTFCFFVKDCDPESLLPKNIYSFPVGSFEKLDPNSLCSQYVQFLPF